MYLFNPKTINKHLRTDKPIPDDHLKILSNHAEMITSGTIYNFKETAYDGEFADTIAKGVLGYTGAAEGKGLDFTVSSEASILKGEVDLALGQFSPDQATIIAPFELKGADTKDLDAIMSGRKISPVQQVWNYANGIPRTVKWVLVSNYVEIRMYGFGQGLEAFETFHLEKMTDRAEYARFMLLLSAENLLTGKTEKLLEESQQEDKDITDALYADYKDLRTQLITTVQDVAPEINPLKSISAAQKILDRVLFVAFAEDTGLLPHKTLADAFQFSDRYNPKPIWQNFTGLFHSIDKGNNQLDIPPYNGGLFAEDPLLDNLAIPNEICEGFKSIGEYDFASEVSVTVLGHIFEQSISDVERLQAVARGEEVEEVKKSGTSGRRKRDGVVYTPDYIAKFIVEQTLGTHIKEIFNEVFQDFVTKGSDPSTPEGYEAAKWKRKSSELEAWEAYRDRLGTLRIVDPSCGSGEFLVRAFDFMKAEMVRVNDKITDLRGGAIGLFDPDSEILTNNLYGVDVNEEAVDIAKLSLWIKTARHGKRLDSLRDNLKVGDSLIEDSNFAYLDRGFSWKTAFPQVFAEGGFDIVLGNPPYVRQERLGPMKPYLETRFEVYHGVADLYCYFFERGLRLLKEGGRLGYISSSTFFKTNSGSPLRQFLPKNAIIEHVIDFGDEQIFEGVTTYPAILVMKRCNPPETHQVSFWNLDEMPKESFTGAYNEKAEFYRQSALGAGSWEFEDPSLKALRDKIVLGKPTLKDMYGIPNRGVTTGRNEAFVIDRVTRDRLIAEDVKSSEVIKPYLEGKDLKRWQIQPQDLFLLFAKRGIDIDRYKAIKEYLTQFQEALEPKPSDWIPSTSNETWNGRKPGNYNWYEIQDSVDYFEQFEKPKIVYLDIASSNPFSMDFSGSFLANTGYLIPSDDLFLLGVLNSKVFWFFFQGLSTQIRGGFSRLVRQYVVQTPIPPATDEQKQALSELAQACQTAAEQRFKLQENFRRRIPDLCPEDREPKLNTKLKNWWELDDFAAFRKEIKKQFKTDIPLAERTDWEDWMNRDRSEIHRFTAEITQNEDKINKLVYELFDLTNEEIELLEANI